MDERLQAFIGAGKEYEINGNTLSLKPFKGKQMKLFSEMSEKPTEKEIRSLVAEALTVSGYPTTLEDTDEMPMNFLNEVSECIMDVNGFDLDKVRK